MELLNKNTLNLSTLTRWKWIILCVLSLIIRYLLSMSPYIVETYYSRGLYPIIRWIFDNSLSYSPIPLIYFFYGISIYFLIKILSSFFKKQYPLSIRLKKGFFSLISFTSFLVFWFMMLWGFNYARAPFNTQMNIKTLQLDSISLKSELITAANEAIACRQKLTNDTLFNATISTDFEDKIRYDISNFLNKNGFPNGGNLRGRQLINGFLFRFGISGIYMPFVGESNIDNAIYPLEKPFTMAHEMAHGYGWTEEATANFIAYLTCIHSDDLLTQYSGYLSYFRYAASNYRRLNPDDYKAFRSQLPKGIVKDLEAINKRIQEYPTWFETDKMNNAFLKAQGVKEGTASYSRVVTLVYSWRLKESNRF